MFTVNLLFKYVLIFNVIRAGHKTHRFTKDLDAVKNNRNTKSVILRVFKSFFFTINTRGR
jgi:hypothetical protein